jgi:hypothetical protein
MHLNHSYHYGHSLPPGELRDRIEKRIDFNQTIQVPEIREAHALSLKAQQGDELAIEQVVILYYMMSLPTNAEEVEAKQIINEAFLKIKPMLYETN